MKIRYRPWMLVVSIGNGLCRAAAIEGCTLMHGRPSIFIGEA